MFSVKGLGIAALVAVTIAGSVAMTSAADARGRGGGGFHGGGFHGGGFHGGGGFRGGGFHGGGFRGFRGGGFYPLYGAGIGLGLYGGYNYGCYRTVRVFTPWGPRWRRVWVCG